MARPEVKHQSPAVFPDRPASETIPRSPTAPRKSPCPVPAHGMVHRHLCLRNLELAGNYRADRVLGAKAPGFGSVCHRRGRPESNRTDKLNDRLDTIVREFAPRHVGTDPGHPPWARYIFAEEVRKRSPRCLFRRREVSRPDRFAFARTWPRRKASTKCRMERDQGERAGLDMRCTIEWPTSGVISRFRTCPPDQNIAMVEHIVPEPLTRVVKADGLHVHARLRPQVSSDLVAQEVGICLLLGRLSLIPDHDFDRSTG